MIGFNTFAFKLIRSFEIINLSEFYKMFVTSGLPLPPESLCYCLLCDTIQLRTANNKIVSLSLCLHRIALYALSNSLFFPCCTRTTSSHYYFHNLSCASLVRSPLNVLTVLLINYSYNLILFWIYTFDYYFYFVVILKINLKLSNGFL